MSRIRFRMSRRARIVSAAMGAFTASFVLMGTLWLTTGPEQESVLTASRPITAGETITESHLSTTSIPKSSGMPSIPASSSMTLIGKSLAYPVAEGTILNPAMFGPPAVPFKGTTETTLALDEGQYPSHVAPGHFVLVTAAHVTTDDVTTTTALIVDIRSRNDGRILVTISIPKEDLPKLSTANLKTLHMGIISSVSTDTQEER